MPLANVVARPEVTAIVLGDLYGRLSQPDTAFSRDFANRVGIPHEEFRDKALQGLQREGLVRLEMCPEHRKRGLEFQLTPKGLLWAESLGVAHSHLQLALFETRLALLQQLQAYREAHEPLLRDARAMLLHSGHPLLAITWAADVCLHLRQIRPHALFAIPEITAAGLEWLLGQEGKQPFVTNLIRSESLPSERRAWELARLLKRALSLQGVNVHYHDADRTRISLDGFTAIFQSVPVPADSASVEGLVRRLAAMPSHHRGAIFSMKGFTDHAYEVATRLADERLIHLFNGPSVRAIILGELHFNDLATAQYRQLQCDGRLSRTDLT